MKKFLLILLLVVTATSTFAQKRSGRGGTLTLPELDSQVVQKYNQYTPKLEAVINAYNAATDSTKRAMLEEQFAKIQQQCDADLLSIYAKNLKVDGVTKRIYSLRTTIPKEQLEKLYLKLSKEVRDSDLYAKSIRTHLDTHQIQLGDTLGDFRATTSDGFPFHYSEFKNQKDILLIFGALSSLPVETRLLLQITYRDVDLSKLEIISIVTDQTDKDQFSTEASRSGIEWLKVSDLGGDHSALKIAFGVEATPMCFYISRTGAVEYISIGIDDKIVDLINAQSYKNRK